MGWSPVLRKAKTSGKKGAIYNQVHMLCLKACTGLGESHCRLYLHVGPMQQLLKGWLSKPRGHGKAPKVTFPNKLCQPRRMSFTALRLLPSDKPPISLKAQVVNIFSSRSLRSPLTRGMDEFQGGVYLYDDDLDMNRPPPTLSRWHSASPMTQLAFTGNAVLPFTSSHHRHRACR